MKKNVAALMALIVSGPSLAVALELSDLEQLGKLLYHDKDLSWNRTMSCATCHHPSAGWEDPENARHPEQSFTSLSFDKQNIGPRNAPTAAYAGYSPPRTWSLSADNTAVYVGGMFWDSRATGHILGDPLAEQAQGPPLNPIEMGMPDPESVIERIRESEYADLFEEVFGGGTLDPGQEQEAYDQMAMAIAAYERSPQVTRFSAKFDRFREASLTEGIDPSQVGLTVSPETLPTRIFNDQERNGLALFNQHCAGCHPTAPDYEAPAPLFTDYSYANLGLPANTELCDQFLENEADFDDELAATFCPDYGLGAVVDDPDQNGKFKVPTLRNIALNPPYGHNGYFADLQAMVAFLNDRSSFSPDVGENVTNAVGNLGLSQSELDALVAFLRTLNDGTQTGR